MKAVFLLAFLALFALSFACEGPECEELLSRIRLPSGFKIEYYVKHALNARSLHLSPANILYIGTRNAGNGNVYAALDRDNDGEAEELITIISGLNQPNGIAFREGNLWVVDMTQILVFNDIDSTLISTGKPPTPDLIRSDLPSQGNHGWRYAAFNPDLTDPYLYIAFGADCNICEVDDIFGTISRLDTRNPLGDYEVVAHGVRNSVGFSWHPVTGNLWFTENGRDMWGNDRPGDELNVIVENGLHYGFPYCYEKDLVDDQFNKEGNCNAFVPAAQVLGPHVASLGNVFYTGSSFPSEYSLQLFIAEHGSWNRQIPIGYRISLVRMNQDGTAPIEGPDAYTVFADGWLPDGATTGSQSWGRPVDVKMMKDGSLLLSDDKNNAVYRISFTGEEEEGEGFPTTCFGFRVKPLVLVVIGAAVGVALLSMIVALALWFVLKKRKPAKVDSSSSQDIMKQNLVEKDDQ